LVVSRDGICQEFGRFDLASRDTFKLEGASRGRAAFAAPDTRCLGSAASQDCGEPQVVAVVSHPACEFCLRHAINVHLMHILGQEHCARWPLAALAVARDNVHMSHTDRPKHYLRQWRKASGLSLQGVRDKAEALYEDRVVAEGEEVDLNKIGLSHSTLSRIESFKVPYNQRLLEVLAEVYGTDVPSLIMRNPEDPEGIWSIMDQIPAAQRPVALRMLSGLKTGTEG
jgi:transcriptional regulator with XRE-family HTH domain